MMKYDKEEYQRNRERYIASSKKWQAKNKEYLKAYHRNYYNKRKKYVEDLILENEKLKSHIVNNMEDKMIEIEKFEVIQINRNLLNDLFSQFENVRAVHIVEEGPHYRISFEYDNLKLDPPKENTIIYIEKEYKNE